MKHFVTITPYLYKKHKKVSKLCALKNYRSNENIKCASKKCPEVKL